MSALDGFGKTRPNAQDSTSAVPVQNLLTQAALSRQMTFPNQRTEVAYISDFDHRLLGRAAVDLPEPGDFTAMSVHARRKLLDDAFDIRVLPRGKGNGGMSPDDFVIRPKAHPDQRIWMPVLNVPAEFEPYTVLRRA